jgi:hypothetical protein
MSDTEIERFGREAARIRFGLEPEDAVDSSMTKGLLAPRRGMDANLTCGRSSTVCRRTAPVVGSRFPMLTTACAVCVSVATSSRISPGTRNSGPHAKRPQRQPCRAGMAAQLERSPFLLRNADQYQLKGVRGRPIDLWVREEIQAMSEIPRIEQRIVKVKVKQA